MNIEVSFPGGKRVDAAVNGFIIKTDQSPESGGEGSAPEPFTLFLSSLATCAGIYVLGFCQSRGIPTDGISLTQKHVYDPVERRISDIRIEIRVPEGFPEKYHEALIRSASKCAVKRALENPPSIESLVIA